MKSLNQFLIEREKERRENPAPRPLRNGEGSDDQDYYDLISHYKNSARHELEPEKAAEFLNHARALKHHGDVSDNAHLGGAYS